MPRKTKTVVYQKPTCSTCRNTLKLLKDKGIEFETINYYEQPLTQTILRGLLRKLKLKPADIVRTKEPLAKELGIGSRKFSDRELMALLAKNPDLIQRPIVVRGNKAILARPAEEVNKLI